MREEIKYSRYEQRLKKRRSNFILNTLIAIVLLLIVIVSYQIFFSDDDAEKKQADNGTEQQETAKEVKKEREMNKETPVVNNEQNQSDNPASNIEKEENDLIVTEGGKDSNVIKTIVNPAWEPVGTVQTGEHVNTYSGVDWDEMVKAICYATGLDESNMIIHFLGNNGPNKSVGTVYTKNKEQIYRVYIEWVDEKGWKPTKVEQLASIPK